VGDAAAISRAFSRVRWPGRLAVVHASPPVVLDGAHNVQGALALRASLPDVVGRGKVRLLFSALRDKRWREMAGVLEPLAEEVVVTEIGGKRGLSTGELATAFTTPPRAIADPADALARLVAEDRTRPILVTGSLFLVGMIYADLMRRSGVRSVFELPAPGVSG
jgi:dihydrofolate synthase/folylpolyglutamate synthase